MNKKQSKNWILMSMLILGLQAGLCQAVGTAVTYQGKLELSGDLANGQFDFQFEPFKDAACTAPAAAPVFVNDLDVTMGLFTAIIDFGGGVFNGDPRWLKISVRDGASGGVYTDLLPAQAINPTPYAIYAENSGTDASTLCSFDPMLHMLCSGTTNPDKMILAHSAGFPNWGMAYKDVGDDFEFLASGSPAMQIGLSERQLRMYDGTNQTVQLNGNSGDVRADNEIAVHDVIGGTEYASLGKNGSGGGALRTYDETGDQTLIAGSFASGDGGLINLHLANSIWPGVQMTAQSSGVIELNKSTGVDTFIRTVRLDGDTSPQLILYDDIDGTPAANLFESGGAGLLYLYNDAGGLRLWMTGDSGDGGFIGVRNATGSDRVTIDGEAGDGSGVISVDNENGLATIVLSGDDPDASTGGCIELFNDAGDRRTALDTDGFTHMWDNDGDLAININASGAGGAITIYDAGGAGTLILDGDVSGDARITTQELVITGGSDLSEQFDVMDETVKPMPGMVVCIDAANPGKLQISSNPYDRKVAGIISGAGGVDTGFMMSDAGTIADGEYPVALTGRVFCQVTAANGAIEPGDLLTTSAVPGHAMKVTDYPQSQGAILGKAMTALDKESGLVLVLVSLQ